MQDAVIAFGTVALIVAVVAGHRLSLRKRRGRGRK